jgi:hypothetical protein
MRAAIFGKRWNALGGTGPFCRGEWSIFENFSHKGPVPGGLFVLCDRQHDGEDHSTVFAPVNDALLGFGGLHRYGTDWTGSWRRKGFGLPFHTKAQGPDCP